MTYRFTPTAIYDRRTDGYFPRLNKFVGDKLVAYRVIRHYYPAKRDALDHAARDAGLSNLNQVWSINDD